MDSWIKMADGGWNHIREAPDGGSRAEKGGREVDEKNGGRGINEKNREEK